MRGILIAVLVLLHTILHANESTKSTADTKHWQGEAEVGFLTTSGNTNTQTLNAKLGLGYQRRDWTHTLRYETLRTEDDNSVTADRNMLLYRLRYQLPEASYLFGSVRYEDDPFAGYNRRTTEVAGYGYQIINEETLKWDVETGVGGRQTQQTDNTEINEAIARLATNVEWRFTETSSFKQEIFVEHGSSNTLTEATSDLKVKINAALAMKLTYKVKNNSDVPVGIQNTDTETSVTLVYDFFK